MAATSRSSRPQPRPVLTVHSACHIHASSISTVTCSCSFANGQHSCECGGHLPVPLCSRCALAHRRAAASPLCFPLARPEHHHPSLFPHPCFPARPSSPLLVAVLRLPLPPLPPLSPPPPRLWRVARGVAS